MCQRNTSKISHEEVLVRIFFRAWWWPNLQSGKFYSINIWPCYSWKLGSVWSELWIPFFEFLNSFIFSLWKILLYILHLCSHYFLLFISTSLYMTFPKRQSHCTNKNVTSSSYRVLENWCFSTVVLEKTLQSPLDCKEIKLVNPKRNQS